MPKHNSDKKKKITVAKAKKILRDNEIGGHTLTAAQKRFFGFIAGGGTPTKVKAKNDFKNRVRQIVTKKK